MKRLVFIVVAALLWSGSALAEEPATYREDEHGHRFRTVFDRHNRTEIGSGYRFVEGAARPTLNAGHRAAFAWDFPEEEIWWRLRHRFAHVSAHERATGWGLRFVLIDADYLRHDVSSWILVPGDSNLRIPGPFDIVVRWEIGGATLSTQRTDFVERWEVFELDFLLDFIRDERYRHRLAIGVTADYEIQQQSFHELTPLSGATALYGWENARGTFAFHAEARYDRWVSLTANETPRWGNRFRAMSTLEWTPVAINDQPLALYASGDFVARDGESTDVSATVGLRLALQNQ